MNNKNLLVKKTISEMMIDRGHQIIDRHDDYFLVKKTDDSEIVVFFSFFEKLNTLILKKYIKEIEKNKINHIIIIYKDKVTLL